jgi:hypothetical protein
MEAETVVPQIFTKAALHARLRPDMSLAVFSNHLWRLMTEQGFPRPVRIGKRSCGWRGDEIMAWLQSRERGGRFDGKRRATSAPPAA